MCGNIAPVMRSFEVNAADRLIRAVCRFRKVLAQRRHAQHPAAVGHDSPAGVAFGAGVKHRHVSQSGGFFQSLNRFAPFKGPG